MTNALPETVDGLPNISGVRGPHQGGHRGRAGRPVFPPDSGVDFARIRSAFAIALHMHQPLIPAGDDLRTARDHQQPAVDDGAPGHRRQPQRPGVPLVLQADGRVHPAAARRGPAAAGDARLLRHLAATGLRQMGLGDVFDALAHHHLRSPGYRAGRRVARLRLGPRRRPLHAGAGLPAARARLAAPLRRHLRPGGAGAGPRLLAGRDGAAQPSRRRLRVRPHAARLRLPVGAGPGAHRRATRRPRRRAPASAAPPGVHRTRAATRPSIIAVIKTQGSDTKLVGQMQPYYEAKGLSRRGAGRPVGSRRWSRRSPTARTAA